jgi:hypothetical protein
MKNFTLEDQKWYGWYTQSNLIHLKYL